MLPAVAFVPVERLPTKRLFLTRSPCFPHSDTKAPPCAAVLLTQRQSTAQ